MIRTDILETIVREKTWGHYILPDYGRYSIAELVLSIMESFSLSPRSPTFPFPLMTHRKQPKKIAFFMVDGFGYDSFLAYREIPFIARCINDMTIVPLTSVFPSTTPAALTTMHTGLTPQEHGLPEWTVYFDEVRQIIETFPFRPLFSKGKDVLLEQGGDPRMLYDGTTVYQELKNHSITSCIFIYHEYAYSVYSRVSQTGAVIIPFVDAADLLEKLVLLFSAHDVRYLFVYWSNIDAVQHIFGPQSTEHKQAVTEFSDFMMRLFGHIPKSEKDSTRMLLTADHGQSPIKNEEIVYLNNYLSLEDSYQLVDKEHAIKPTGAPHDVFLHIYPPKLQGVLTYLQRELEGKAQVFTTEELLSMGLFGRGKVHPKFINRIGNLVILPHSGYHVWYKFQENALFHQRGTHGGLSQSEMIVPFVFGMLSEIAL